MRDLCLAICGSFCAMTRLRSSRPGHHSLANIPGCIEALGSLGYWLGFTSWTQVTGNLCVCVCTVYTSFPPRASHWYYQYKTLILLKIWTNSVIENAYSSSSAMFFPHEQKNVDYNYGNFNAKRVFCLWLCRVRPCRASRYQRSCTWLVTVSLLRVLTMRDWQ